MKRATQTAVALGLIFGAIGMGATMFACGSSSNDGATTTTNGDAGANDAATTTSDAGETGDGSAAAIVAARPYNFHVPTNYDKTKTTPLVIMLHGYTASGAVEEAYFQLTATSDAQTFLYAYPDGTVDTAGNRFWNADDACCDFYSIVVDDVAYVNAIIDDVSTKYNVDPKRIFVIGHSNGAFMSHRLACDVSDRVAAIASLAGAVWNDPSKCNPTSKISVLDIHGDADTTINYDGGIAAPGFASYPGESQTMSTWAAKNGCTGAIAANGQTLDLDSTLPGSETVESQYAGCPSGIDVELWTIHGGSHVPSLTAPTWGNSIWAFFSAHPKP